MNIFLINDLIFKPICFWECLYCKLSLLGCRNNLSDTIYRQIRGNQGKTSILVLKSIMIIGLWFFVFTNKPSPIIIVLPHSYQEAIFLWMEPFIINPLSELSFFTDFKVFGILHFSQAVTNQYLINTLKQQLLNKNFHRKSHFLLQISSNLKCCDIGREKYISINYEWGLSTGNLLTRYYI